MQRVKFLKDCKHGKEGTVTNMAGELLEGYLKDKTVEPVVNDYEPPVHKASFNEDYDQVSDVKPKQRRVRKKATKKVAKEAA